MSVGCYDESVIVYQSAVRVQQLHCKLRRMHSNYMKFKLGSNYGVLCVFKLASICEMLIYSMFVIVMFKWNNYDTSLSHVILLKTFCIESRLSFNIWTLEKPTVHRIFYLVDELFAWENIKTRFKWKFDSCRIMIVVLYFIGSKTALSLVNLSIKISN